MHETTNTNLGNEVSETLLESIGGRLRLYSNNWEKITSDSFILQTVNGLKLDLNSQVYQQSPPFPIRMNEVEKEAVDKEIQKLLSKNVIEVSQHEDNEFISNLFTRAKKDGGLRMILNLRELNKNIDYQHFKMDTFETALKLVTEDCYMASIDLKDAYFSVPVCDDDQKYLKFLWRNTLFKFKALPNGLASGPRIFTKLLKPVFATLRMRGHVIVGYIDDTLIIGNCPNDVKLAVSDTVELLEQLGFTINKEKSIFTPTKEITFLGFKINSESMRVRLTEKKANEIAMQCKILKKASTPTIHELASVIGKLVASFSGMLYGQLYYRELEKVKIYALKCSKGNFQGTCMLNTAALSELDWWIKNVQTGYGKVKNAKPQFVIQSDASGLGWGAFDGVNRIGGRWNAQELARATENQINYLELLAAFFAVKALCHSMSNITIQLQMDNTTAIAYINKMGGVKSYDCNELAKSFWSYCATRNLWITAVHLPGVLNVEADRLSRVFQEELEWMLDRQVFVSISHKFGVPEIDLFASRLNAQVQRFVSWKPDPDAEAVDAFTLDWGKFFFYAFPPFCLISLCLQKIIEDGAEGIMIVPLWPTQAWYSQLAYLLVEEPILLPSSKSLLINVMTGQSHPLKNLKLLCCRLSGQAFRHTWTTRLKMQPWTSSWRLGDKGLECNTAQLMENGYAFVNGQGMIRFGRL